VFRPPHESMRCARDANKHDLRVATSLVNQPYCVISDTLTYLGDWRSGARRSSECARKPKYKSNRAELSIHTLSCMSMTLTQVPYEPSIYQQDCDDNITNCKMALKPTHS
jgi:hypothetical protein